MFAGASHALVEVQLDVVRPVRRCGRGPSRRPVSRVAWSASREYRGTAAIVRGIEDLEGPCTGGRQVVQVPADAVGLTVTRADHGEAAALGQAGGLQAEAEAAQVVLAALGPGAAPRQAHRLDETSAVHALPIVEDGDVGFGGGGEEHVDRAGERADGVVDDVGDRRLGCVPDGPHGLHEVRVGRKLDVPHRAVVPEIGEYWAHISLAQPKAGSASWRSARRTGGFRCIFKARTSHDRLITVGRPIRNEPQSRFDLPKRPDLAATPRARKQGSMPRLIDHVQDHERHPKCVACIAWITVRVLAGSSTERLTVRGLPPSTAAACKCRVSPPRRDYAPAVERVHPQRPRDSLHEVQVRAGFLRVVDVAWPSGLGERRWSRSSVVAMDDSQRASGCPSTDIWPDPSSRRLRRVETDHALDRKARHRPGPLLPRAGQRLADAHGGRELGRRGLLPRWPRGRRRLDGRRLPPRSGSTARWTPPPSTACCRASIPRPAQRSAGSSRPGVPGFDLTFSAPKSVSVLFGVGDDALRTVLRDAHDRAVLDALGYMERAAAVTRRGPARRARDRGQRVRGGDVPASDVARRRSAAAHARARGQPDARRRRPMVDA